MFSQPPFHVNSNITVLLLFLVTVLIIVQVLLLYEVTCPYSVFWPKSEFSLRDVRGFAFFNKILLLTNRRTSLYTGLIYKINSHHGVQGLCYRGGIYLFIYFSKSFITTVKVIMRHLTNPSNLYETLFMSY